LLGRLKSGTFYPKEIYNINQKAFNEVVDREKIEEEEDEVEYEIDEEEDEIDEDEDIDEEEMRRLEEEEDKDGGSIEDIGSDEE